jgi:hypothetical protein
VVSLSAKTLVTWSQHHTSWFIYNHYLTISHTTSQPHLPQTPSFPGLLFTHPPLPILFLFYSTQYTVHLHNLVAFLYCSKFFPLGFIEQRGFDAPRLCRLLLYYLLHFAFSSFLAWYTFLVSPTHRTTSLPSLPVVPHLRPSLTIRKVFPSREAIQAFTHLAYSTMLPFPLL